MTLYGQKKKENFERFCILFFQQRQLVVHAEQMYNKQLQNSQDNYIVYMMANSL